MRASTEVATLIGGSESEDSAGSARYWLDLEGRAGRRRWIGDGDPGSKVRLSGLEDVRRIWVVTVQAGEASRRGRVGTDIVVVFEAISEIVCCGTHSRGRASLKFRVPLPLLSDNRPLTIKPGQSKRQVSRTASVRGLPNF